MATLTDLQSRLDKLETARGSGILTTEYDGRRVTFKSDADLAAAIAYVKQQIAAAQTRPLPTCGFAGFYRD